MRGPRRGVLPLPPEQQEASSHLRGLLCPLCGAAVRTKANEQEPGASPRA